MIGQPWEREGSDRETYIEGLHESSIPDKPLTAQLSGAAKPLEGCIQDLLSHCDGTYRTKSTWSDGAYEED